jgi:hypothetical protein
MEVGHTGQSNIQPPSFADVLLKHFLIPGEQISLDQGEPRQHFVKPASGESLGPPLSDVLLVLRVVVRDHSTAPVLQ